jgi:hypothetical protein
MVFSVLQCFRDYFIGSVFYLTQRHEGTKGRKVRCHDSYLCALVPLCEINGSLLLPTEHTDYTEGFLIIISVYSVCSVGNLLLYIFYME